MVTKADVAIYNELMAQIEGAGLAADEIDWELGSSEGPGRVIVGLRFPDGPTRGTNAMLPFRGTKQEFDSLLANIARLRKLPAVEYHIDPRPPRPAVTERLAGVVCPVCRTSGRISRAVYGDRGGRHGSIVKCGNRSCLSLYWVGEQGGVETILRASPNSAAAVHLYGLEGDDPGLLGWDRGRGDRAGADPDPAGGDAG